jgi:hypothetical protein
VGEITDTHANSMEIAFPQNRESRMKRRGKGWKEIESGR